MNALRTGGGLFAACAAAALVAGLASGSIVLAALAALAVHAAWQAWTLRRLAAALRRRRRLQPPFPPGAWGSVFAAVRSLQIRGRKRKQRLKRFVSRFQDAASALPDGFVLLGRDFRIEWRNAAAARLLGLETRACIGTPITAHVHDPLLAEHLSGGDFAQPIVIAAPGERSIILSVLVTPFGRRRQHALVARDITRTYYLDRTRADFVANVSHELRTPLTVLSGNLEILVEQGEGAPPSPASVASMCQGVERMQQLVDDLLTLSRLELTDPDREQTPVDVSSLLDSVLVDARMLAGDQGHVLELDADRDLWLLGDAGELRSVVSNLVGNAIRYTPARTRVTVRWHAEDGGAALVVSDNGAGIAARHLPRLTERFYRVDPGRGAGGTGLGLAIVKHALERHDATLGVTSREGFGTTFTCSFPAVRVTTAPAREAGPAAGVARQDSTRRRGARD